MSAFYTEGKLDGWDTELVAHPDGEHFNITVSNWRPPKDHEEATINLTRDQARQLVSYLNGWLAMKSSQVELPTPWLVILSAVIGIGMLAYCLLFHFVGE